MTSKNTFQLVMQPIINTLLSSTDEGVTVEIIPSVV